MAVVSTCLVQHRGETYGSEERVGGQLAKVGAEAIATLGRRMLCELLRWAGRNRLGIGRVHGEQP
jgi:hypothetical protein